MSRSAAALIRNRHIYGPLKAMHAQTMLNPFHTAHTAIKSSVFDVRVRASARKHL